MRPASQRFFIHSCIYLRILIISYLATFLGTNNSLSVLMCRKEVNQSIASKCETDYRPIAVYNSIQLPRSEFPCPHRASVGGISDVSKPLVRAIYTANTCCLLGRLAWGSPLFALHASSTIVSAGPHFTLGPGRLLPKILILLLSTHTPNSVIVLPSANSKS